MMHCKLLKVTDIPDFVDNVTTHSNVTKSSFGMQLTLQ